MSKNPNKHNLSSLLSSQRWIVALLVAAVMSGCRSAAPMQQDSFYRFAPAATIEAYPAPVLDGGLYVEQPRVAGVRRGRALLYSDDSQQLRLRQYHYHHWEEAPAKLIQRRLVSALRQAALASSVSADMHDARDYVLRTELRRFDRLLGNGGAEALLELNARLSLGRDGEPLLERNYRQRIAAESERMTDTVVAFSTAVDRVVADLLRDLQGINDAIGQPQGADSADLLLAHQSVTL